MIAVIRVWLLELIIIGALFGYEGIHYPRIRWLFCFSVVAIGPYVGLHRGQNR